jgi:hypothetical protein
MRLDVTTLGGAGRTVAQVAGAIVEYLDGGIGDPGGGLLAATVGGSPGEGLVSYYGDSAEEPGRWIGQGAAAHRLDGTVERATLARVLPQPRTLPATRSGCLPGGSGQASGEASCQSLTGNPQKQRRNRCFTRRSARHPRLTLQGMSLAKIAAELEAQWDRSVRQHHPTQGVAPLTAAYTRRALDADDFTLNTVDRWLADRAHMSDCIVLEIMTVDRKRGVPSPTTPASIGGMSSPNNASFDQLDGQVLL